MTFSHSALFLPFLCLYHLLWEPYLATGRKHTTEPGKKSETMVTEWALRSRLSASYSSIVDLSGVVLLTESRMAQTRSESSGFFSEEHFSFEVLDWSWPFHLPVLGLSALI